jgi:hydrogenase maturation protease
VTEGGGVFRPGGIAVIGLGNVLMGDDAVGPYVVACLEAHYDFPPGVELIDAGTPGHELAVHLEGRDAVIVVDAVGAPGEPGKVVLYEGDDVAGRPLPAVASSHEPGLRDALLSLDFSGRGPRQTLLVGVVPESVGLGTGLSRPVQRSVPEAERAVVRGLARFGAAATPKTQPASPSIWWETAP